MRDHYAALMADPAHIETILQKGAEKARLTAQPFMAELRHAVGLRRLAAPASAARKEKPVKADAPSFKQYREADGRFYFKLLDARGRLLVQSQGFDAPREAAKVIANLQQGGPAVLAGLHRLLTVAPDVAAEEIEAALHYFSQPAS
jgi:tryptophanyl-tRNA synthetase